MKTTPPNGRIVRLTVEHSRRQPLAGYKPAVLDQLVKKRDQQLSYFWHRQVGLDTDLHTLHVGLLKTVKGSFHHQSERKKGEISLKEREQVGGWGGG